MRYGEDFVPFPVFVLFPGFDIATLFTVSSNCTVTRTPPTRQIGTESSTQGGRKLQTFAGFLHNRHVLPGKVGNLASIARLQCGSRNSSPPTPTAAAPARMNSPTVRQVDAAGRDHGNLRQRPLERLDVLGSANIAARKDLHEVRSGIPGGDHLGRAQRPGHHRQSLAIGKLHRLQVEARDSPGTARPHPGTAGRFRHSARFPLPPRPRCPASSQAARSPRPPPAPSSSLRQPRCHRRKPLRPRLSPAQPTRPRTTGTMPNRRSLVISALLICRFSLSQSLLCGLNSPQRGR